MQRFFCFLFIPHLSVRPLLPGNWEKMFRKRRSSLTVGCVRPSASLAQPVDELWGLSCSLSPADARPVRRSKKLLGISVNDGTMSDQSERNEEMMDPREDVDLCRIQAGSRSEDRVWPQDYNPIDPSNKCRSTTLVSSLRWWNMFLFFFFFFFDILLF